MLTCTYTNNFIPRVLSLERATEIVWVFCFKQIIIDCLLQCYNVDQMWQISKSLLLSVPSTTFMSENRTTYHLLCIIASFLRIDQGVTILLLDPLLNVVFQRTRKVYMRFVVHYLLKKSYGIRYWTQIWSPSV